LDKQFFRTNTKYKLMAINHFFWFQFTYINFHLDIQYSVFGVLTSFVLIRIAILISKVNFYFSILSNFLWYGIVRDYEAKTYQFTPTFFTSPQTLEICPTRIHYTMCWVRILNRMDARLSSKYQSHNI